MPTKVPIGARSVCRALLAAFATALLALLWLHPAPALAQACCAGGAAADRANPLESSTGFVGLELSARTMRWIDGPDGYRRLSGRELELRQLLFGGVDLPWRLHAQASLPFVQTHRSFTSLSEWGGGVGDGRLLLRVSLLEFGEGAGGLDLEGRLTVPTGRSPFDAQRRGATLLMTDVTGTGVWAPGLGIRAHHTFAALHVEFSVAMDHATTRSLNGRRFRPGSLLSLSTSTLAEVATVGPAGASSLLAGASLGFERRGRAHLDGETVRDSEEVRTSVAATFGLQRPKLYVGARVGSDLPVRPFSQEVATGFISSLTLRAEFGR